MVAFPQRFRETEARNRQLGRALRIVAGVREPDPEILRTIGERLLCRDEPAAALVRAMRATGRGVTMEQFRRALDGGLAAVPDAPQPLRDFFAAVEATPDWVDFDLVEEGARVARRLGTNGSDVLLQLALIGSYRFAGPAYLLVATGGLTGGSATRRLAETQHWAVAVIGPGAMRRGGAGFRLTVQVRLMHAMVNHRFEPTWDTARWGLPINQADQAATLGLFSGVQLLGVRLLGVRLSGAQSRAFMHLWKYVGWLLGVDEDWLCDTEREQYRLNYHHLLAQSYGCTAGPPLAGSLVEAQRTLHFGRYPRLRGAYARARLLSMLRYFLGKQGLQDLGLPAALPWAVPPIVAANLLRYQLLARTPAGRAYLERWGDRNARRLLHRYFGPGTRELAAPG